jgi:two-component system nitrate/nitrite sensor histidine kinase NarX
LEQLTKQIDQERTDERRLVAADLHDEVLQPLFHVSLMTQVALSEAQSGRLSEAAADLNHLVDAANSATATLRELIGDLRRPGLGRAGLASALYRLVGVVREQGGNEWHTSIAHISADSVTELVLYQIAKEALNNATLHSESSNIWVDLAEDDELIRLTVRDDGKGFDSSASHDGHYGVQIMRERAKSIHASLFLDTAVGEGCSVTALVPKV